jgi:hypothetical protein
MDGNRSNRILDEWDGVANAAGRPVVAPRPRARGLGPVVGLAGTVLAALAIVVGLSWLGGRIATSGVGNEPTLTPAPVAVASPSVAPSSPTPSASPSLAASASPSPSPTPVATLAPCSPNQLESRITAWEGAAGSRIADVTLRNTGSHTCVLAEVGRPTLIDGKGTVLAAGKKPTTSATSKLAAGATVKTLVMVSNVCIDPVTAPVTIVFDLDPGGHVVAAPLQPDDATVPPCNGPGQPASIEMQSWQP